MDDEIKTAAEIGEANAMPRKRDIHTDGAEHVDSVPEGVAKAAED